jgi:hypothetical protein
MFQCDQVSTVTPAKKFYRASDGEVVAFFIDNGQPLPMRFIGRDETVITERMDAWWSGEKAKIMQRHAAVAEPAEDDTPAPVKRRGRPPNPNKKPAPVYVPKGTKGKSFIGSKWMVDKTGARHRVPPNMTEQRVKEGWKFKGARAK